MTARKQALELLLERERRKHNDGKLGLLAWTAVRRSSLKPGVLFDLRRHPYLVDLYQEQARGVVVYKASQMGASEWGVSYALHAADERSATVLYVFPTETHVTDFSTARIGPALEASKYLSAIVSGGSEAPGNRRKRTDRVTLKRVRDRFLYLRGGQVKPDGKAPQLKSIDADVLILDEVDEMDARAPAIAVKRLGHSALQEERWISTPTYPGVGIHAKWLESDQREWFVRCGACGELQPLTIQQVVHEWDNLGRPVAWHGQGEERAFVACRKCGREVDRLQVGQWVAAQPGRPVVGYHLTKLFSATTALLSVVQAFQTVDETKRREAFNQDLGEPYTPRGGRLTPDILDACRREYAQGAVHRDRAVAGCDVGKLLHVVIRGAVERETGERPLRWAGAVESFGELKRLCDRFWVRTIVVDALPETRSSRKFQDAMPGGRVWLAYYGGRQGSKKAEPVQFDEKERVVTIDRTRLLDEVVGAFVEGLLTLPANARDIPDYYAHLQAPVRVLETGADGQPVARYVESGPDHLAHAEVYCRAAASAPATPALPSQKGLETSKSQWD